MMGFREWNRKLFFVTLLFAVSGQSRAADPCEFGDPEQRQIQRALEGSADYRDFIASANKKRRALFCSPNQNAVSIDQNQTISDQKLLNDQELFHGLGQAILGYRGLKRECVVASLKRELPVSSQRAFCRFDRDTKPTKLTDQQLKQCYTKNMIDYMQSKFNQASLCLHAMFPDMPLSTEDFFKLFNTESGFQFYANSPQRGMGQLTGDAVRDILTDRARPGSLMLEQLKRNLNGGPLPEEQRARLDQTTEPALREAELQFLVRRGTQFQSLTKVAQCQKYLEIVQHDLKRDLSTKTIPACYFISLDRGIDRNLFYSMLYFAGLRQQYTREIEAMMGTKRTVVMGRAIDPKDYPRCSESNFEFNSNFLLWATYAGYGDGPNAGSQYMRYANCDPDKWYALRKGAVPPNYPVANQKNRAQQIEEKYEELVNKSLSGQSCF